MRVRGPVRFGGPVGEQQRGLQPPHRLDQQARGRRVAAAVDDRTADGGKDGQQRAWNTASTSPSIRRRRSSRASAKAAIGGEQRPDHEPELGVLFRRRPEQPGLPGLAGLSCSTSLIWSSASSWLMWLCSCASRITLPWEAAESVTFEPLVATTGVSIRLSWRRAIFSWLSSPRSYWVCWRRMYVAATVLASSAEARGVLASVVMLTNWLFSFALALILPLAATFAVWLCCALSWWRASSVTTELMMSGWAEAVSPEFFAPTPFSPTDSVRCRRSGRAGFQTGSWGVCACSRDRSRRRPLSPQSESTTCAARWARESRWHLGFRS